MQEIACVSWSGRCGSVVAIPCIASRLPLDRCRTGAREDRGNPFFAIQF
jgi:hypothetical protein